MDYIWIALIGILATLGLFDLFEMLGRWMSHSRKVGAAVLIPLSGRDDIEGRIREVQRMQGIERLPIIIVDGCNGSFLEREICERLCLEYPGLTYCRAEELSRQLETIAHAGG